MIASVDYISRWYENETFGNFLMPLDPKQEIEKKNK